MEKVALPTIEYIINNYYKGTYESIKKAEFNLSNDIKMIVTKEIDGYFAKLKNDKAETHFIHFDNKSPFTKVCEAIYYEAGVLEE